MAGLCRHHQGRSLYRATFSCRMCGACRLQTAINNAAEQASTSGGDRRQGAGAKHLKPIQTAVELVFGSAAALSATFGYKVCTLSLSSGLHEAIRHCTACCGCLMNPTAAPIVMCLRSCCTTLGYCTMHTLYRCICIEAHQQSAVGELVVGVPCTPFVTALAPKLTSSLLW